MLSNSSIERFSKPLPLAMFNGSEESQADLELESVED